MKSVYKFVFPLLLGIFLCFVCITVAHAENSNDVVVCNGFEVGDTAIYYVENLLVSGQREVMDYSLQITDSNKYICMYIATGGTVSGYALEMIGFENGGLHTIYCDDGSIESSMVVNVSNVKPHAYSSPYWSAQGILFNTNIPVFENYATASAYVNNKDDSLLSQAVNYKKAYQNGNWVKPFENIDINDSTLPVPVLSNISHESFKVDDVTYDYELFIDIYVESGIQNPFVYIGQDAFGTEPLFVNNYGLVSDLLETPIDSAYINLISDFGINNLENLNNSKNSFYQTYLCAIDFYNGADMLSSKFHKIWGQPFAKPFVFWSVVDDVKESEYLNLSVNNMPLCYTNYKVRYYYYNEEDGMHYGPWASVTYYSDGRVEKNSIYEDNNGNIIDTPIENGTLDDSGNISINTGSNIDIGDFDNPNELFGYLRSIINNISVTSNSFMALFSAFFTVIPAEIQATMWLSIALMCFGSLILWVWRK